MIRKWIRSNGDFQHLPSWRKLVVATALSLRRHPHRPDVADPRRLPGRAWPTRERSSCTSSWEADANVLRERLNARVTDPGKDWDQAFGMTGVDETVAAAARQPGGTLMLRSDRLTPAELADEVLAAAGLRIRSLTVFFSGTCAKTRLRSRQSPDSDIQSTPRCSWTFHPRTWLQKPATSRGSLQSITISCSLAAMTGRYLGECASDRRPGPVRNGCRTAVPPTLPRALRSAPDNQPRE
jgi:hypothetical protein